MTSRNVRVIESAFALPASDWISPSPRTFQAPGKKSRTVNVIQMSQPRPGRSQMFPFPPVASTSPEAPKWVGMMSGMLFQRMSSQMVSATSVRKLSAARTSSYILK